MEENLRPLAKAIHDQVFKRFFEFNTTIFLCGAGTSVGGSVREKIDEALKHWIFYIYRYDLVYPEDLFDELLYGENHQDLMSLEHILADSVDVIVLIVESIGAVAELGAFSSNEQLRKKLVCVVESKYKKAKSFINNGPVRLLKDTGQGVIIYSDFSNIEKMTSDIQKAITKVKKGSEKIASVTNILQAHHFILPCIFLLEPIQKSMLHKLVEHASDIPEMNSKAITTAALSMLLKKREVTLAADGYHLTTTGQQKFAALGRKSRVKSTFKATDLDALRVAVINWKCRGKPLRIG